MGAGAGPGVSPDCAIGGMVEDTVHIAANLPPSQPTLDPPTSHTTPLTLSYQYHAVLILVFTNYSTMLLCHRQAGQLTCKHVRKVLLEVV